MRDDEKAEEVKDTKVNSMTDADYDQEMMNTLDEPVSDTIVSENLLAY